MNKNRLKKKEQKQVPPSDPDLLNFVSFFFDSPNLAWIEDKYWYPFLITNMMCMKRDFQTATRHLVHAAIMSYLANTAMGDLGDPDWFTNSSARHDQQQRIIMIGKYQYHLGGQRQLCSELTISTFSCCPKWLMSKMVNITKIKNANQVLGQEQWRKNFPWTPKMQCVTDGPSDHATNKLVFFLS